jgi:hypothetical protein
MMESERFDSARALASLKTFQRRTVDYVFGRLFHGDGATRQFLVADEVGLGKTMVARGVIARTIEHLWDTTARIDIVYICSNQAIAAQNLNRLNVLGSKELALPTRMTLVPLHLRGDTSLAGNKVNFISLTPRTSFDLRSATGVVDERAFLYHLLETFEPSPARRRNLLQVHVRSESWATAIDALSLDGVEPAIVESFLDLIRQDETLSQDLLRAFEMFGYRRDNWPQEHQEIRNAVVARLRAKLSRACVHALQPDLIVLDEFQRFRDLLHGSDAAALLARELFDYVGDGQAARTLLLSATPYKMLSLHGDAEEGGHHHRDFLDTIAFLYGGDRGAAIAKALEDEMRNFRRFLHGLPDSYASALDMRDQVERRLRQVMARTERVNNTAARDSMVREVPMRIAIEPADLTQAALLTRIVRLVDAPDIVEYWKSAPYLLNFMHDYALKRQLREAARKPSPALLEALNQARGILLDREAIDRYAAVDMANGRMRALAQDVFGQRLDQHLWLPPALRYYGDDDTEPPLTKALVFSSWSVVPDAVAALLSYEAERRAVSAELRGDGTVRYFDSNRPRPLKFSKEHERLSGLRSMLLLYPSPTLASQVDPFAEFARAEIRPSLQDVFAAFRRQLQPLADGLSARASAGASTDAAWEWAAPVILDCADFPGVAPWLAATGGLRALADESGFADHVAALAVAADGTGFGALPDGVLPLLADAALGSPAVCALRALRRVAPELAWDDADLLQGAAEIAWAFRTLFNQHESVALLRSESEDSYWRAVLSFCADHHVQAMLDEYAHYLLDAEGLGSRSAAERVRGIAAAMARALSIRPAQIEVDDPVVRQDEVCFEKFHLRGRFAMRLGDYKDEDNGAERIGAVRDAFNSPFRPFVLASTSVGQEGLDFHPYCYRIYHWNLPGNPVDLEQREGRVHRYKGHAIRLNLAQQQGAALQRLAELPDDPWAAMFAAARAETSNDSDLVPYWICEGRVYVERCVPMLPFSREHERLEWLKRSLAVYRLAFGQPRQDDLLHYLNRLALAFSTGELARLQITLEPR